MNQGNKIDIEDSIEKAIDYLIKNQHKDGSVRLQNETRWQVWETANAIIAVHLADKKKTAFLERAINFLLSSQREDGSFYYTISFEKDNYCTETTSECILALATAKKDVSKSISFILNNQCPDGSWDIGTPGIIKYRCWPSVTGFALKALLLSNVSSEQISKGIEFLHKTQQEDGSWGSKWIYYDTPYYTIHVILFSLKLFGFNNSDSYKKAVNFIKNNQNKDGSWETVISDKPRPSIALRTTLAINSLLISPDESDIKSIEKGIEWLINAQQGDGHWDGGYFVNWPGKKEDIYATSMAIYALKNYSPFMKKLKNFGKSISLKMEDSYDN